MAASTADGNCLVLPSAYQTQTCPEMKVERVSYDVMTPSAARACFEAQSIPISHTLMAET